MIIVTINLQSHQYQQTFNKDHLTIGNSSDSLTDILLPFDILKKEHVKIDFKNGFYYVYNLASDPFVTVNGMPFGKRKLNVGDRLAVHSAEIFFDLLKYGEQEHEFKSEQKESVLAMSSAPLKEIIENKIQEKTHHLREIHPDPILIDDHSPKHELDEIKKVVAPFEGEPLFDLEEEAQEKNIDIDISEIEALLEEAERLESILNIEIEQKAPPEVLFEEKNTEPFSIHESEATPCIKDNEIKQKFNELQKNEILETLVTPTKELEAPLVNEKSKRKIILWLISAGLLIAFLITLAAIELSGNPAHSQVINAARTAADTSMSLLNAKLDHLKPHNQNWSDTNFLKDSLNSILSSRYTPFLNFDAKGSLVDSRYILRIYNTHDLSRFLVVLHPSSSIVNWLIPDKAVLIDSHDMQIRLYSDFKDLQKILATVQRLDEVNHVALTQLIQKGEVLPLEKLTDSGMYSEFSPSKELANLSPGAENLIYNAPRYFKLTSPLIDEAAEVGVDMESSPALTGLTEELKTLSQLKQLVLYSSEGLEGAITAQKGIMKAGFNNKFIIAYLIFDSKNRPPVDSEIIPELPDPEPELVADSEMSNEDMTFAQPIEVVDNRHIHYDELTPEEIERMTTLKPVTDAMLDLISNHSIRPVENFYVRIQALLESCEKLDRELIAESDIVSPLELHLGEELLDEED